MAEPPSAIYVRCPLEGEETLHTVLKGEVGERGDWTLDATVRCRACDHTHHVTVREPGDRAVPVVVSEGDESRRTEVQLPRDDVLAVDDALVVDGRRVLVTALEDGDGRRPHELAVPRVATVWTKDHETVVVKVSLHEGDRTEPRDLETRPSDEIAVGDDLDVGGRRLHVHAIKTHEGKLRSPGQRAQAADIVRVYGRPPEDEDRR